MTPFGCGRWPLVVQPVPAFVVALVVGCGVRTSPRIDVVILRDAAPADAPLDRDVGIDMTIARIPCEADADCPSGTVCRAAASLVPTDLEPVPLFCEARGPVAAADGERCGGADSAECERELCVIAGTCVVPCRSESDCLFNQRCAEVYVRTGPAELQPVSACTDRVVATSAVRRQVDLGVAVSPGGFSPVEVMVGHVWTTTIGFFAAQSGEDVYLEELRDPTGNLLFDLAAMVPGAPPPSNPVSPFGVALTLLLPSGGDVPIGDYTVELLTDGRGPIDRILLDRIDPGRIIDLDLYFVAGRLVGPDAMPITRELQDAIDRFRVFYREVGLVLGDVRTHAVVGALGRGYATLEMDADGRIPETDTLFALTAGAQSASVSWFFVRDAEGVLGVSGGVPGAQCLPGTAASGIAFSSDILGSGVPLSSVLIHETGHFLGLFHTSELDGTVLDPFVDTPSCGPERDANGDGMLLADECVGAGADNIMFWAATDAGPFTTSQSAIVSHALLLR